MMTMLLNKNDDNAIKYEMMTKLIGSTLSMEGITRENYIQIFKCHVFDNTPWPSEARLIKISIICLILLTWQMIGSKSSCI